MRVTIVAAWQAKILPCATSAIFQDRVRGPKVRRGNLPPEVGSLVLWYSKSKGMRRGDMRLADVWPAIGRWIQAGGGIDRIRDGMAELRPGSWSALGLHHRCEA